MALTNDERAELERLRAADTECRAREKAEAGRLSAATQAVEDRRRAIEAERLRIAKENRAHREKAEQEEADAIADLHAQAIGVINIKNLIPVVLDLATPHYNRWCHLFLLTLGKYALTNHVLSDDSYPAIPAWARMECTVLAWLHKTISTELSEVVHKPNPTARRMWLAIEEQFVGNHESRALLLDAQLRNIEQGDLSVTEFCRKMKNISDTLGDLGEPVPDRTLVMSILRGLNDKFQSFRNIIKRTKPFPSFSEVRSDLMVEEITM
jgi:hypothetical protein